ncbi:MAG: DUF1579 domain-containing protein [Planctomycetes bacterium]|nr:DUF1579 domain-containing protein [Planctomycetota bacterium]
MRPVAITLAVLAAVCPLVSNADEPEKRSAELQVLDRFVGTWDIKMTVKVPGQEAVNREISETRKLSRGGAVLEFENAKPPEFHMLWGYDPKSKKYTGVWMFGGDRGWLTGTWNERTSTMKLEGAGADASSSITTFRFLDKDHSESSAVYRDRDGKVVSEVTWKHTRRGK